MKYLKAMAVMLMAIVFVGFFGCVGFQDAVTPQFIDEDAATYAKEETKSYMPYTTIMDGERIAREMDFMHDDIQINLQRCMEDDQRNYLHLKNIHTQHSIDAKRFQQVMFSPDGVLGALIPGMTGLGLGWLALKRPGDKSKKELDVLNVPSTV